MKLTVWHAADAELLANSQWYDERLPGLGDQLTDEVQAVLARIESTPAAFARFEFYRGSAEVRRALLLRFPISVIFLVESDSIVIWLLPPTGDDRCIGWEGYANTDAWPVNSRLAHVARDQGKLL